MAEETQQGNIRQEYNSATVGLNMDQSVNQIKPGTLTYALNAALENFDANSVNYQNEPGNELCVSFPNGYSLIGDYYIQEKSKHIFFLTNSSTAQSEIGYMDNNDCIYRTLINADCLNFSINYPIHKVVHRITNCATEIYWTDGINARRYMDIDKIPYITEIVPNTCDVIVTNELDCNKLKIQPDFSIPQLEVVDVVSGGELLAGTYQFAVQYSDISGNPYTSYYSVTNPCPIADPGVTTVNFNYNVGKSIIVNVSNLETSGQFQYFNLAVIKTINNVASVELLGTYYIDNLFRKITYTGQNVTNIRLSIDDIFEKFPYYDIAQDITVAQDVLIWDQLSAIDRVNYQEIANQITLLWETWRIPATENYSDEFNATNLRGYLRDEVYAFEVVFLLDNGKQTDGFHIPGRTQNNNEFSQPNVFPSNPDFIGIPDPITGSSPYWKIYNTGSVLGTHPGFTNAPDYKGPYEFGEFAYWESEETYPCNKKIWGDLAGQPIRHHKFPDILVSPAFESAVPKFVADKYEVELQTSNAIYPIGVKINVNQIKQLINSSNLTREEKAQIVGFKIVRGDRSTNRSIVAKGMLRNVGTYERQEETFYYPNYPYNDLAADPFLNAQNNAYSQVCEPFDVIILQFNNVDVDGPYMEVQYTDCNTNKIRNEKFYELGAHRVCSITKPTFLGQGPFNKMKQTNSGPVPWGVNPSIFGNNFPESEKTKAYSSYANYDIWAIKIGQNSLGLNNAGFAACWLDAIEGSIEGPWVTRTSEIQVNTVAGSGEPQECRGSDKQQTIYLERQVRVDDCKKETPQPPIPSNDIARTRQIFNSPETSFGQPFLGDILKLENVMYGAGRAHFVEVRDNAKYRLLSKEAQEVALNSSFIISDGNVSAMFAAYQAYLTIYINGITRKNYAYSFNSRASYSYSSPINNNLGIKQRDLDIQRYLIPGVQNVGDDNNINNFNRETSVYLKTNIDKSGLPFPNQTDSLLYLGQPLISDYSRFTISESNACSTPEREQDIEVVSYYGSLKNIAPTQWGQIYSYVTIDTGFQLIFNGTNPTEATVFGGDTFISRFAYKTKLPFFLENRVNAPDDSDVFYDVIGNIAYPKYWHSARSILSSVGSLTNFISYKATSFDCPNDTSQYTNSNSPSELTYYDGYFYMFAYGVPSFYCETSYNLDLRQAFNNREGDFWPHVSSGIPDDWVQQSFVPIEQDNTYYYNVTFSKQNKENFFSHLPNDWDSKCFTEYPFRAIYSDVQVVDTDNRVNNWLIYRAISYFDFPQNYGGLTSLDGIQNKAILARFENKSLLYNTMLTIDTSNPQAAYIGNPSLFRSAPPIDFAETDLGYVGSQNKFLLKIPQGQITVDAKRGQIFLISGTQAVDLTAFGSGVNRFMTDHLSFEILRYFPKADIDNHFNGIGLHGVYDSKFDRIIITKLDYIPLDNDIKYDDVTKEFYLESTINDFTFRDQVYLDDSEFFCNKSWTISFNFNTKSWVSFHSYIPNFYIGENNFFYSGLNGCCDDVNAESTFEALVGEINRIIPTTTTSTTIIPLPTTTTTSTLGLDCELEGVVIETSCELDGDGYITVPPTTTTTICQRSNVPNSSEFITGYLESCGPEVITTGSSEDACAGIAYLNSVDLNYVNINSISISYFSLELGQIVYLDSTSTDCTTVPDGFYFTQESSFYNTVYEIENGMIVGIYDCSTTTTTTTFVPNTFCYTVQMYGNLTLFWVDGTGTINQLDKYNVDDYSIVLCAQFESIYFVSEEDGYIFIEACGDACTDVIDCPTTTTTTTI
jgi:hypothetical protein